MTTTAESNNTLYFIVGGLVVLALVFGLFFWSGSPAHLGSMAPAAGDSVTLNTTVETTAPAVVDDTAADSATPVTPANEPEPQPLTAPATQP